jgi:DNA-binding beta-propeller fold protein YncE
MVLKESEGLDVAKLMEDHQILVTRIQDVDFDEEGNVYILDDREGNVVGVDLKTGSLIRRISSMGQGPAELMRPMALRIRNKKVFVLSGAFIKIFSLSGEFLSAFRPESLPRGLDVDRDENIYVARLDREGNPTISAYDIRGNRIKTAWTLRLKKETLNNRAELTKNLFFFFRLDQEGNIIILQNLLRKLTKVSPSGALLWERKIENSLLEPFYKNEKTVYDEQGPIVSFIVNMFDIDQHNNIVITHQGGGCIYNPKGELIYLIEVQLEDSNEGPRDIRLPRIFKDRLLAVFIGSNATLFPYRFTKDLH